MNVFHNIYLLIRNIIKNIIDWKVIKKNNYTFFDMIRYELNNYVERKNNK